MGEYNATTGATINAHFIGLNDSRHAIAMDALNHLLVADGGTVLPGGQYVPGSGSIGEYDGATGATIDANFVAGLDFPFGLALDGSNHLFVCNDAGGTVGEYDAATGATINATFISSVNELSGLVFVPVPEPSSLLLAAAAGLGVGILARRWFTGPGRLGRGATQ